MTHTPDKALGEAREPMKRNGVVVIHGEMIRNHVEAIRGNIDRYENADCPGRMIFHGERVAREDGSIVVHWDGDALFRNAVCEKCGDTWAVETAYRVALTRKAPAIKQEEVW